VQYNNVSQSSILFAIVDIIEIAKPSGISARRGITTRNGGGG